LKALIPDCVEIRGNDKTERKEKAALDYVNGNIRVLISKPSIFGYGLNFQQCRNMVFCGLDFSFESYYQAVRRVYRFGQDKQVNVWRVMGENEKVILDTINRKAKIKQDMNTSVSDSVRDFQIEEITGRIFKLDLLEHKASFPSWIRSE
jgi:SNF2 family DNA or RNA helicase